MEAQRKPYQPTVKSFGFALRISHAFGDAISHYYMDGYERRHSIERQASGLPAFPSKHQKEQKELKSTMPPRKRKKENAKKKAIQRLKNLAARRGG